MSHVDGVDDGVGYGVAGLSFSGNGVIGRSYENYGVVGLSDNRIGVYGTSNGTSDSAFGVFGTSPNIGVYGGSEQPLWCTWPQLQRQRCVWLQLQQRRCVWQQRQRQRCVWPQQQWLWCVWQSDIGYGVYGTSSSGLAVPKRECHNNGYSSKRWRCI